MPEPTPAEELRTAAATLREHATEDQWWAQAGGTVRGPAAPRLALALADLLDVHADVVAARTLADGHGGYAVDLGDEHALATARAVNAKEQP